MFDVKTYLKISFCNEMQLALEYCISFVCAYDTFMPQQFDYKLAIYSMMRIRMHGLWKFGSVSSILRMHLLPYFWSLGFLVCTCMHSGLSAALISPPIDAEHYLLISKWENLAYCSFAYVTAHTCEVKVLY